MKTLAIRLEEDLHAQLSVLAQLRNSTLTDEIRLAIEARLESSKSDPTLTSRAQGVLDDIERESQGRKAAIATLFAVTPNTDVKPDVGQEGTTDGGSEPSKPADATKQVSKRTSRSE